MYGERRVLPICTERKRIDWGGGVNTWWHAIRVFIVGPCDRFWTNNISESSHRVGGGVNTWWQAIRVFIVGSCDCFWTNDVSESSLQGGSEYVMAYNTCFYCWAMWSSLDQWHLRVFILHIIKEHIFFWKLWMMIPFQTHFLTFCYKMFLFISDDIHAPPVVSR